MTLAATDHTSPSAFPHGQSHLHLALPPSLSTNNQANPFASTFVSLSRSDRMKTIPSQDCNPFAHRNPTGTSSSTTSASGGQSTQAARPLVTPLRPTSQKIRRRRDDPRNRNLPRRTTTSAARDITIPRQSTSDQLIMNNANNLDNPLYLDETHFPALAVYHPAQVQQTPQRPRCRWAREPNFYIRSIPHTFCRHFECLTTAEFVSNYPNATITQERVLLSILYTASFIWEETVEEMGFTIDTGDPPPVSMDPRTGQVLEPIGWLPLYVKLHGPEHDSMQLVWFGVLAGSPAEVGVRCIIGEPDLRKIYGSALDIERYNRERGA